MHGAACAIASNGIENSASFLVDLFEAITVRKAVGSATPTFTRATAAAVSCVAPAGNAVDGEVVTQVGSGEVRFAGARRVSASVYSRYYADGTPIPRANLIGAVIEFACTNQCLYSEDFTNGAWVGVTMTVTGNAIAAPDGNTTADLLTATGANSTILQTPGLVAANKTFSVWMKRKTGTGTIQITNDGVTWTTVTLTSSWKRFTVIANVIPVVGIRLVTSGDEVYAWGAQLESALAVGNQRHTTSYQPTTVAAVTKDRDQLTFPFASNALATVGTIYVEYGMSLPNMNASSETFGLGALFAVGFGNASNGLMSCTAGGAAVTTATAKDGTNTVAKTALIAPNTSGVIVRRFCTWGGPNGLTVGGDGAAEVTGSFDGNIGSTAIGIGIRADLGSTEALAGYIRKVVIWPVALTAAQCAQLGLYGKC